MHTEIDEEEWDIMGDLTRGYFTGLMVGVPFGCFITWCLATWYTFESWLFLGLGVSGFVGFIVMCLYLILTPSENRIL